MSNIAAYKNASREQKLALEISAAKKERDFYLSKVEKSRALTAIEERMKKVKNGTSVLVNTFAYVFLQLI